METPLTIVSYVSPNRVQELQYEANRQRLHSSTSAPFLNLAAITDRFALSQSIDANASYDTSWFKNPKPIKGDVAQLTSLIAPYQLGQPPPSRRLGVTDKPQSKDLKPRLLISGLEKPFEQHADQTLDLKFKFASSGPGQSTQPLHSSPSQKTLQAEEPPPPLSPQEQLLQSLQIFALPVRAPPPPPPPKRGEPAPLVSNWQIFEEAANELQKNIKAGTRPASAICKGQRIPKLNTVSFQNSPPLPPSPSPPAKQSSAKPSPQRPQSAMPKLQASVPQRPQRPVSASPSPNKSKQPSVQISQTSQAIQTNKAFEPAVKHRTKVGTTPTVAAISSSILAAENSSLQIRVLKYVAQEAQSTFKQQLAKKEKPEAQYEAAAILPPTRYTRPQSAPGLSRRPISAVSKALDSKR